MGAQDMENKIAEQMMELTKNTFQAMLKLQEINDRTMQTLAKQQLDTVNNCMKTGVKQLKAAGDAKNVKDAVANQTELASELSEMLVSHAKQSMDILNQSKSDLTELVNSNMKQFMDVSKVTK